MKRFLILHYGFIKPTTEDMAGWNSWFASVADRQVDQGGLASGREISSDGTKDLPFQRDSITGYTMIEAEDLDEAEKIAAKCPIVDGTRVYEVRK